MSKLQPLACIDAGSSKVATLIVVPNQDANSVHVIGAATTESKGIKKSQIVDIEEAIKAIMESVESAERMAGMSVSQAYINISGSHIGSKNSTGVVAVAQPEGEINEQDVTRVIEAARAVSLPTGQEIIHVLPRSYKVDAQEGIKDPVGMSGVRLESEAHIITGSSGAIKNLGKCITEIGVRVARNIFSGLASSESVLTDTEKELGVVLVDIGGGTTAVAVWIDGSLSHSVVLPIGAKNVTNDLAIGMRANLNVAEKVKCYLGQKKKRLETLANTDNKNKKEEDDEIDLAKLGIPGETAVVSRKTLVEGIIRPRLQEIFTMIGMELKNSGFGGQTPAGIVLTGGGAKTVGIELVCKRILSLPTRIGYPHTLTGLVDEIHGDPAYATAEGLILYALKNQESTSNSGTKSRIKRIMNKIPVKGAMGRAMEFLKQFLP